MKTTTMTTATTMTSNNPTTSLQQRYWKGMTNANANTNTNANENTRRRIYDKYMNCNVFINNIKEEDRKYCNQHLVNNIT